MSVRRRIIRDRIRTEAKLSDGRSVFEIGLQKIQIALTQARARGETRCTERFLIEAFHEESPALETPADLIGALQDRAHVDAGPFRAGQSVKETSVSHSTTRFSRCKRCGKEFQIRQDEKGSDAADVSNFGAHQDLCRGQG